MFVHSFTTSAYIVTFTEVVSYVEKNLNFVVSSSFALHFLREKEYQVIYFGKHFAEKSISYKLVPGTFHLYVKKMEGLDVDKGLDVRNFVFYVKKMY